MHFHWTIFLLALEEATRGFLLLIGFVVCLQLSKIVAFFIQSFTLGSLSQLYSYVSNTVLVILLFFVGVQLLQRLLATMFKGSRMPLLSKCLCMSTKKLLTE